MSAALAHRGPDGAGEHAEGPVALAARRLALVDRPGGHQPASGEDGSVRAMLNGELYDLHALRRRLAGRGHALATRSDTEALVHLYEDEGPGFVAGLRGMFALAVWDAPRRRLLLARDRFGIKPLLYAHEGSRLAFASELGALCALPDLRREVDLDALEAYLTVNAVHAPRTMLAGVCKLPPGHLLLADSAGVRVERYARDLPAATERVRREPLRDLARETRERLRDSVRAHLVADVPVGMLLSGGVDSGGVAALAAQQHGPGLQTFTIGFRERSFDELSRARLVARRYATDHHELVVTAADAEALLPRLAQAFDEPRGDATALPYWLVARMAAGKVKAVLSGEGADELFGGYQTYAADLLGARAADAAAALAPALARWPSSSRRLSLDFRARQAARAAPACPPSSATTPGRRSSRPTLAQPCSSAAAAPIRWRATAHGMPRRRQRRRSPACRTSTSAPSWPMTCLSRPTGQAWPTAWRCGCRSSTRWWPSSPSRCPPTRGCGACAPSACCAWPSRRCCPPRSSAAPSVASSPRPPRGCAASSSRSRGTSWPPRPCAARASSARQPSRPCSTATSPAARI